ncbi:MAG: hypothetical protein WBR56_19165 [Sedimenticolaceae bacterium]
MPSDIAVLGLAMGLNIGLESARTCIRAMTLPQIYAGIIAASTTATRQR